MGIDGAYGGYVRRSKGCLLGLGRGGLRRILNFNYFMYKYIFTKLRRAGRKQRQTIRFQIKYTSFVRPIKVNSSVDGVEFQVIYKIKLTL